MRLLAFSLTVLFGFIVAFAFGSPPSPQPIRQNSGWSHFDVQVHNRDRAGMWDAPMQAQHGADCSGPPATHSISSLNDAVFICNDHVMTSANANGYGAIYLTPSQVLSIPGTVDFDISTQRMSTRDWWDVTVSPFLEAQALPLLSDLSQGVDLQGPNRNSIVVTTDNLALAPNLKVVRNGSVTSYGGSQSASVGIAAGTNQAAVRQPYRLTITATSVRFERLPSATGQGVVFFDRTIPALAWSSGVVQFGHHSYNPTKDNSGSPATWHWSGFTLTPSTPFTLIHADRTLVTANNTRVTFDAPAPANAYLRFAGFCRVLVDGVQVPRMLFNGHPEHASSFMVPIAQGKQSVNISFAQDSWLPMSYCRATDFAIWSQGGAPSTPTPSSPTPTVTPVPTATSTPAPSPPATATPVPPTATSSPSPTSTSVPPTSTPTPAPPYECRANGVLVWSQSTPRMCP